MYMDEIDVLLLAIAAYVAVAVLVKLMLNRHQSLVARFRRESREEQQKKAAEQEEKSGAAKGDDRRAA